MDLEYNKLTTSLLAQGFTADNHPDYVKLPGCIPDKADPLKNYNGGFVYQSSYTDSLIYKTGCGKFVKGRNVLHDMGYMGIDWCHENDNPVLRCPYDNPECSRNNPLLHGIHGSVLRAQCWCECHQTAEPYDYQNSIKLANAEREAERRQKYEEYAMLHHGRICANHMYYDEHTRTWSQRYEPHKCFRRCCSHFCPIRNRELSKKRGNVYYDLNTIRIRHDGTLFDGEKIANTTKTIQELNLSDGFLFAKVMDDKEICRKVLEKILGISIREVSMPARQRTAAIPYEEKSMRFHVYDRKTVYNVEMECRNQEKAFLPKKARYYEESMDLDIISAGEYCGKLKKSFVIFICTFDPFSDGRHIYTFENRCREYPSLALGDEATKIFLNTKGTINDIDQEMQDLLSYMENTTDVFAAQAASPLVREIHKRVTEIKQNEDMADEYANYAVSFCESK